MLSLSFRRIQPFAPFSASDENGIPVSNNTIYTLYVVDPGDFLLHYSLCAPNVNQLPRSPISVDSTVFCA